MTRPCQRGAACARRRTACRLPTPAPAPMEQCRRCHHPGAYRRGKARCGAPTCAARCFGLTLGPSAARMTLSGLTLLAIPQLAPLPLRLPSPPHRRAAFSYCRISGARRATCACAASVWHPPCSCSTVAMPGTSALHGVSHLFCCAALDAESRACNLPQLIRTGRGGWCVVVSY